MPPSPTVEAPLRASATATRSSEFAAETSAAYSLPDLVCFAHLHWDFVWQRPQHLLSRFAQHGRVFYVEDVFFHADDLIEPHIEVKERENGVKVVVAHLPNRLRADEAASDQTQFELLSRFFVEQGITKYVFWYYTPMAVAKSRQFQPVLTVYDCMDELANFKFAHPALKKREQELFQLADLVFTGGQTLYEARPAARWPSPPTRPVLPTRASAFLGWSTNGWTLCCCASWPPTIRPGSLSSSGPW